MDEMLKPGVITGGEFRPFESVFLERWPHHRFCKAGEVIFGQKERGRQVCYYLISGRANSFLLHENGGAVELTARRPGSVLPLYFSYSSTAAEMVLEIVASTDCDLLVIPRSELRLLMMEKPEIAFAMIDAYASFSNYLDYELASRLFDSLETRVCNFLSLHVGRAGYVKATQNQIAQAVGGSRVKVTVILGKLAKEGILETGRGKVTILNRERLEDRCSYIARLGSK